MNQPTRTTKRSRAPGWVALCLLLASVNVAAQVKLPDFGDASATTVSPADEKALGEAFMREVRVTLTVTDDPDVEAYIQELGYRLVSKSDQPNYGFTFFVVEDDSVNAFAAPGGYIGIHSGLILETETESELASVVAHEVAHVTQRHIARAIQASDRSNLPALAGIIAAVIIGSQNAQAGQATAAAVIGSAVQKRIDFTRQNEKEADRVGMQLLNGAGFDARAMPTFFEKLQSSSRYYRRPPEFLSTHPVTSSRIADSRNRAEQLPYRHFEDSFGYHLTRAKLRVRTTGKPERLLAELDDEIVSRRYRDLSVTAYARALTLGRLNRHTEARTELQSLVEAYPARLPFRVSLAESEFEAGDADRALSIYREALALSPDSKALVRGYARSLLQSGQAREALETLQDYQRLYSLDAPMYRLLAEAQEGLDRTVESQASLAEHYYLSGQLDRAIHQLRLASRQPNADFYRASRIEARLQELEAEHALRARR